MGAELPEKIGRFEIDTLLGRGAMGVVYLATDPVLGRRLAVKCIQVHPGLSDKEVAELRQRFENEARAAATLSHPNLVTVFDAGADDHTLYIAMEYVQGEALDDILAADRVLTYKEVADLALQLGAALDHAHRQEIVHRDIKPANILINRSGQPKITDFGVARQAASTLTATGTIIGTPAYMSPEQITGHAITGAADQFSLAIVLYELLTGRKPFFGEGATTVLYKIVHEEPEPPNAIRKALPGAIDTVILRALSKDPAARFGSCTEFAEALRGALGAAPAGLEVTLRSHPAAVPTTAAVVTAGEATHLIDRTDPDVETVAAPLRAASGPSQSAAAASADPGAAAAAGPSLSLSSILLWGGAAVAGVLIVALAIWAFGSAGGVSLPEAAQGPQFGTPSEELAASSPPEATAPVAPTEIALRIITRPEGASVTIDGIRQASTTPLEVRLPVGQRHQLLIERAGYDAVAWAFAPEDLTAEQIESGELFFPLVALASAEAEAAEADNASGVVVADLPPVDPVQVRGDVQAPVIVEQTRPPFPDWAAEQGLPRYVILELVIDREGRLREARVLNNVHPTLGEQAVAAVRAWIFEPAIDEGEPVDVLYNVTVQFDAGGDGGA